MRQTDLSVPGVHCGACITTIETALREKSEVERARVNLSTRRVSIVWKEEVAGKRSDPGELVRAISERGYETHIFTPGEGEGDAVLKQLIRAVAVLLRPTSCCFPCPSGRVRTRPHAISSTGSRP